MIAESQARRFTPDDNLIHRRGISTSQDGRACFWSSLSLSLSLSLCRARARSLSRSGIWIKEDSVESRRDMRGKRLSKAGINYLPLFLPPAK